MEAISPLNNADKIGVPLLIAHGDNDSRVPLGEGLEMYRIVKEKGVHVGLIVCEKEGHGALFSLSVSLDFILRLNIAAPDRIQAKERDRIRKRCAMSLYRATSLAESCWFSHLRRLMS